MGRSSEDLLGATMEFCSWKIQVRRSGVATMTMGAVFRCKRVLSYVKVLQDLGMLGVSVKL